MAPVVVLERPSGLGALGRSADLVWGSRWRILGLILLVLVFAAVLNIVIALVAGLAGTDARNVAGALLDIAIAPIPAILCAVLYFELLDAAPLADPSF
jgi:ABC-type antimicrobial peptide transport system permease subunit